MNNLIINRIKYELIQKEGINIYCSKSEAMFRLKYQNFIERLKDTSDLNEFKNWFGNYDGADINEQPYVYFDFQEIITEDSFQLILNEACFKSFRKNFVKYHLINHLKKENILIEPYITGVDLSAYIFSNSFNDEWDKYFRYDFRIKPNRNEIIFNKTSENILISKTEKSEDSFPYTKYTNLKAINTAKQFIGKVKYIDAGRLRIIANNDIKRKINAFVSPKKVYYKGLYNDIREFYKKHLLNLESNTLKIQSGGFLNVPDEYINTVYFGNNEMVFKNNKTDINAATGMRYHGSFKPSPIAKEVQFIFIYENSDDANKLYQYLKNGLKHFPGLQTYVEIPITLADLKLKYDRKRLKKNFDKFLSEKLPDDNYKHYFVILISPFKKEEKSEDYYYIKKELLNKRISSQFISYQSIRSEYFHFYLPNIAIAILAKLGGIPWKLKEQSYKELIIGFNTKKINDTKYIGSAVFFDNQGYLKNVNSYEGEDLNKISGDLKQAIKSFREENSEELKRVVIHTYKPYGKAEREIERLLRKGLELDTPLVYIEINDVKTTAEVCFDENYNYGMPISGTYVKTEKGEYLLFNNTRYKKKPLRSVTEEWPIKLRIYTGNNTIFDEKQLISQVYEFSRLYWKGLKQRSQPVTTIYSKLIADYAGNFNEPIPKNKITQKTPWFI
ncbi:MAG: Piwi domain-containing protein [Promethearchaeota archaeon]